MDTYTEDDVIQTRPSRLYLPKFDPPPPTIFEYLLARFPQIDAAIWRVRVSQGLVTLSDGTTIREDSPYRHGVSVFYRKEVASEPPALEEAQIVYRDDDILVVDKPHGMPVTPSGQEVERSLFVRLQRSTGLPDLAPMHRLDRETAGLVLFAIQPAGRKRNRRRERPITGCLRKEPSSGSTSPWHTRRRLSRERIGASKIEWSAANPGFDSGSSKGRRMRSLKLS